MFLYTPVFYLNPGILNLGVVIKYTVQTEELKKGGRMKPNANNPGVKSKPSSNQIPPATLSPFSVNPRWHLWYGHHFQSMAADSIGHVKFNEHLLWSDMNNVYITEL